ASRTRDAIERRACRSAAPDAHGDQCHRGGLRFHPSRLSALAFAAAIERSLRRPLRADFDAVRVLRARRPVRSRADDQEGARASQSRARDRGAAAHDVRPAQYARAERRSRARAPFLRQALSDRRAAPRAAPRGIPALHLDRTSKGAQAYLALAGEILRRMETAAPVATPAAA